VLKVADPTDNFAWSTKEASVFGTGVYTLPGTVLGGQMKVSIFGGHNWLSLEMKNGGGAIAPLDADQFGKARNESVIVGGTALWSQKNTYALATFVGMWGDTSLTDSIDDCGVLPAPNTCAIHKYNFNTSGSSARSLPDRFSRCRNLAPARCSISGGRSATRRA